MILLANSETPYQFDLGLRLPRMREDKLSYGMAYYWIFHW